MPVIHPVCCGLDAHAAQLTACLRRGSDTGQITTALHACGTPYNELVAFRTWLQDHHGPVVALESTGVSWKPVDHGLSDTIAVLVAKSRDVRQRPGTKTDKHDALWSAALLAHGLIKPRVVPPPSLCA